MYIINPEGSCLTFGAFSSQFRLYHDSQFYVQKEKENSSCLFGFPMQVSVRDCDPSSQARSNGVGSGPSQSKLGFTIMYSIGLWAILGDPLTALILCLPCMQCRKHETELCQTSRKRLTLCLPYFVLYFFMFYFPMKEASILSPLRIPNSSIGRETSKGPL